MVEQNNNRREEKKVRALVIDLNLKEKKIEGNDYYNETTGKDREKIEIRTVDFNSKDISDDLKRQMLENFRRRTTDYALSIKSMIKQKQDRAIREGLSKNLVQEEK